MSPAVTCYTRPTEFGQFVCFDFGGGEVWEFAVKQSDARSACRLAIRLRDGLAWVISRRAA